jgi:hypothetical protein
VLQKINDPVRATVICDTVTDLRDSIRKFQILAKQAQIKTVYSNKWEMDYSNGYVGVHANVLIPYNTAGGSSRNVRGEVQFHLSQINDGSQTSLDAISHLLYELGRMDEDQELTEVREKGMVTLFSSGIQNVVNRE